MAWPSRIRARINQVPIVGGSVNPPDVIKVYRVSQPAFKITVLGLNFQAGIKVYLAGLTTPWSSIKLVGNTKIMIKKAGGLSPNDSTRISIRLVNPDGGEITVEYNRTTKTWRVKSSG
jgi:hypothetical protein